VCTDYEIDSQHAKRIQQHYVLLMNSLDVKDSGLIADLFTISVLDLEEKDDLESRESSRRRTERLLSMLSRKSSSQFEEFLEALGRTGQEHIAKEIRGTCGGRSQLRHVIFVA
jgi:hypothetical protein